MEAVKMPPEWHAKFIGIQLYTGAQFKVSKVSATMDLIQMADYAIDLSDGYVFKSRDSTAGEIDLQMQQRAIDWLVLHDDDYCCASDTYRRVYPTERNNSVYRRLYGGIS